MFPELPEGTDVSMLEPFLKRVERATSPDQVMGVVMRDYGPTIHAFRRANWQALGMEPAPAPGGSVEEALDAGFFKMRLRDGTDGFFMRRTDDCDTATLATLAGVHPSLVPDPHEMRRILAGSDPELVIAELDDEYEVFAVETGVRLRLHSTPPVWSKRWIGVIEKDDDPLANHLMVMSGQDLLFDPAHPCPPDDGETALEGFGVQDISFGYTLDD